MTICKPLHDKVLVRLTDTTKVSAGGIVLAPSAVEKPNKGIVVAVGPGRHLPNGEFQPTVLKEGDTILFAKGVGYVVKIDDENLTMLNEEDVMATLG